MMKSVMRDLVMRQSPVMLQVSGCGAYLSTGLWFQVEWPRIWGDYHITVKDMLPILLATTMWG